MSTFKWSNPSLNSEFYFSQISHLTKAKKPNQLYLPIAGRKIDLFMAFSKGFLVYIKTKPWHCKEIEKE